MRLLAVAMTLLAASSTHAQMDDTFLCVADKATGFSYNKQSREWEHARFNVADSKYTLSKRAGIWRWKKFGESTRESECEGDFNVYGYLNCNGIQDVSMNNQTLRYQIIYPIGYVITKSLLGDQGGNTPSIEIGRCSKM